MHLLFKIGEIIEASTGEFVAQCYELHQPPPFGSLVKTREGEVEIYGVVSGAATTSIEPGRRPIARGRDEAEEEDIYRASPQLAKLLRTDFNALVVGHREGERLHHYLPPRPARVHSFVYLCDPEEVARFSQSFDFLSILVNARGQGSVDELIAACLRHAAQAHQDPRTFLIKVGKELAVLLGGETSRLNTILRRIRE
ncbi:MAG: hypothetical protein E3J65_00370 [Dehalococcoidia bacterium]|nr:MAG: hypothetical protein E3J65_00370 [Dehalococcoidia bacterium]